MGLEQHFPAKLDQPQPPTAMRAVQSANQIIIPSMNAPATNGERKNFMQNVSFLSSFLKIFLRLSIFFSLASFADIGLQVPRFGTPFNLPAFAKTKSAEISFSRSFFENRFLLGIDPILNIADPQFETGLYRCIEKQMDELSKVISSMDKTATKPRRLHITVMEVSGELAKNACQPDIAVMSDTNHVLQICYSRVMAGMQESCRIMNTTELLNALKRYSLDQTTKEKAVQSLKQKSEQLLQLLSK